MKALSRHLRTLVYVLAPAASSAILAMPAHATPPAEEQTICMESVAGLARPEAKERLQKFCTRSERLATCVSAEGRPIPHIDSINDAKAGAKPGKRILLLGLIHGDEKLAGEMALEWTERLSRIPHRNDWRAVPILNPDGLRKNTRTNARGVDLNRNFPTADWNEEAQAYWKKQGKMDPRRFPGESSGSEPETRCVVDHINDFKPDFIVSVHTPYHVLDFDGPVMKFPAYRDLPWRALGNFPGSLGRLMWKDRQVPVLTIELGNERVDAARLQDIVGSFAIEAAKRASAQSKQPDVTAASVVDLNQ